ncbi:microrchidia 7-like protein [Tanacetum coccineum]|uniref:Microrchidia 7-like protein n=1 Tax=Tanacetum coccineum TaxID=301880 RepID=A0ABQ4Y5V6_9ASTR
MEVCGIDHLRVHPRFLHSNATSHKWVLGAFAELLDNSLDEVCNGATYVKIDMLTNKKDDSRMLLIEDNGGGMDPEKMRHCMSLGYSLKSKVEDTIGQYGNGFKTSTMRLGADVIVFSRCSGKDGKRLVDQTKTFDHMKDHGTRVIIYNLWEDDQGQLELDFDTDKHDIQIRGVNRDERNIEMAQQFPNSRHFLTYRHSLRSYAAILYLRVPHNFRMILRGKDVEHHNIINDMMMTNEVTYRPQPGLEGVPKDSNMVAIVTVGFVKDAKSHIDVQGFNVYHKNRLIKPFWRIWNAAGSDGRGVIGVLEANFVEPAHDKQGFERTNVLQRLETRLVHMQKTYWNTYCHKIGYAPRRNKKNLEDELSPDYEYETPSKRNSAAPDRKIPTNQKEGVTRPSRQSTGAINGCYGQKGEKSHNRVSGVGSSSSESTSPLNENIRDDNSQTTMTTRHANGTSAYKTRSATTLEVGHPDADHNGFPSVKAMQVATPPHLRSAGNVTVASSPSTLALHQLMEENRVLKEKLKRREDELLGDLLHDLESERNRCKELEAQYAEEKEKYEALIKEQESISTIFTEEKERRDAEEENLKKKLKEAEITNKNLMEKVKTLQLEKMKAMGNKWSH